MRKWLNLLGCTSLFYVSSCIGQVINIDREVKEDSVFKNWDVAIGVTLSSDKQKKNLIDGNFTGELVRNLPSHNMLLFVIRNDVVISGREKVQNEGMMHLRFRDRDTRQFSPEAFAQYQWNGIWGMDYRLLAGMNGRIRVMEKSGFDLYGGSGLFREWERWTQVQSATRSIWRWNNYLKMSAKLSGVLDLSVMSFLQFPLTGYFGRPRWYLESNAYVNAGKRWNVVFHWDHIVDAATLLPVDHFFYGFSAGIQINY